jgi:hypothetical protein
MPSEKVVLPPTSDSVEVGTNDNEMETKGKKSGATVAFGTVDTTALVTSIVENSVKNSKVKGKKVQLDVLEGTEEGAGASTVMHLQPHVKTTISAASEGPYMSQGAK